MPNDPEDFNKNNGFNSADNKDDFVDSSFAVQFKPGDKTESVSDKLKESKANLDKGFDPFKKEINDNFKDRFKDEFDDFEFDSSISAFKPLSATPNTEAPAAPEVKPEPVKPAEAPKATEVKPAATSTDPVFPKNGGTFDKPAEMPKSPEIAKESVPKFSDLGSNKAKPADEKIFKSGSGLDFATSEHDKKTSPFMNAAKPDIPAPDEVDIPRAEKQSAPAPAPAPAPAAFKAPEPAKPETPVVKPQATAATGYRPYPSATKGDAFTTAKQEDKTEIKKEEAKAVTPAPAPSPAPTAKAEPVKPDAPAAPKAEPAKPVIPAAKVEPAKPVAPATAKAEAPKTSDTIKTAATAAAVTTAATAATAATRPVAPAPSPAPAPVKSAQPVKAPAETERPHRPASEAKPKAAPAPAPAPVQNARPGASTQPVKPAPAKTEVYSPFEPKSKQPATATRGVKTTPAVSHDNKAIQPVTPVKKPKKNKVKKSQKDPGLVGLITFLAIIVVAIGVLWALDYTSGLKALFGKKEVETIVTVVTDKPTESSKEAETETTETTTEATTTTTEATTTTSETTEATTTTTTEETTEATTTTTTEATTEATTETTTTTTVVETTVKKPTSSTAEGSSINDFDMKITNFAPTSGGFKFDISLKNKSGYTASLPKSLYGLDIKLYCNQTITEVTSEALTFEGDGTSFRGTPNEVSIAGGDTYTFTVYVSTSGNVSAYGYNYAYFDWVK